MSLIRLTYKSIGEVSLKETWVTYPWLCTEEDVSLLPQQILTDYESSERGGASWVPPLSMTECSQVPYAGLAQVITAAKSSRVWQPSPSHRTALHSTLSLPPALPFYLPHVCASLWASNTVVEMSLLGLSTQWSFYSQHLDQLWVFAIPVAHHQKKKKDIKRFL